MTGSHSALRALDILAYHQIVHPLAGLFSALRSEQLYRLDAARAGRVPGLTAGDGDQIATFVKCTKAEIAQHDYGLAAARARHPGVSVLDLAPVLAAAAD